MYADVQELYPGGAQNLESKLRRSAALAAGVGQDLHHIPTAPRTASSDIGLSTRPPSLQVLTGQDSVSTAIATGLKNTSNIQDNSSSNKDQDARFLLLCVSNSRRLELEQIPIMLAANDQIMFQDIRRAYLKLRRDRTQQFHPKTPKAVRYVISTVERISAYVQRVIARLFECMALEWLVWWIGDSVLVIPHTASFVRVSSSLALKGL